MKKKIFWMFWVLFSVLLVSVTLLIIIQVITIKTTDQILQEQFDKGVKRSLYSTAKYFQEQEIQDYIDEMQSGDLESLAKANTYIKQLGQTERRRFFSSSNDPTIIFTPPTTVERKANTSIEQINALNSKKYMNRVIRSREMIDLVTMRLIYESPQKNISDRIDLQLLDTTLHSFLLANGINECYDYVISNQYSQIVKLGKNKAANIREYTYTQQLFPNEDTPSSYFINVKFKKSSKLINTSIKMLLPSLIIGGLLFLVMVATIFAFIKGRKDDEIKTDFINNITHELKTPISSISLASQMLKEATIINTPKKIIHVAEVITEESRRLSFLVEKVLRTSIGDSNIKMNLDEGNLNELIETVYRNFSLKVKSKQGALSLKLEAYNAFVLYDEMHMTNIIYNILDNAVKYSKAPPVLNIKTYNPDDHRIIIELSDNGIGISKDHIKHIFDRFYRVPQGNLHDVKGFGLGLAYVKQIVDKHNGTIYVESTLDVGTTFILEFNTMDI